VGGATFFSDVHSKRTRGNRHMLQKVTFQQSTHNRQKSLRMIKCWNRLPREIVVSPTPEITKSVLDKALSDLI